jgi:hypothetical protein
VIQFAKTFLQLVCAHEPLRQFRIGRRRVREVAGWESKGRPVPPAHPIKQRVLAQYAVDYHLKMLAETGTCCGDMIEALKAGFERIWLRQRNLDVVVQDDIVRITPPGGLEPARKEMQSIRAPR